MVDKRADPTDTDLAYAVLKAGYRPFDCSRQASRREALAKSAQSGKSVDHPQPEARPAEIVDLNLERTRRDWERTDPRT